MGPAVHRNCLCAGFTSDLAKYPTGLDHRIDHIFFASKSFSAESTWVIGDRPSAKTPSGLWPSDHAASVAVLRLIGHDYHHGH